MNNSNGVTAFFNTVNALPATLTVGQSGPLATGGYYHDTTLQVLDATFTQTYSVLANSSTSLLLCTNQATIANANNDGLVSNTTTSCLRLDSSGNIAVHSIQINVGGQSLLFQ